MTPKERAEEWAIPLPADIVARLDEYPRVAFPIIVNWFPPLTEEQVLANAMAHAAGRHAPHPNPNMLTVTIAR